MECKKERIELEDKVETRIWKSMGKRRDKYWMRRVCKYEVN